MLSNHSSSSFNKQSECLVTGAEALNDHLQKAGTGHVLLQAIVLAADDSLSFPARLITLLDCLCIP
jgi:hypothetical protein